MHSYIHTCACTCVVFITRVDSCDHHSQDTEQFYDKDPLCCWKPQLHPSIPLSLTLCSYESVHLFNFVVSRILFKWNGTVVPFEIGFFLSKTPLRPIQVFVWTNRFLFLFLTAELKQWQYHCLFTCWRTFRLFPGLAITNKAVWTFVYRSFCQQKFSFLYNKCSRV